MVLNPQQLKTTAVYQGKTTFGAKIYIRQYS